MLSHTLKAGGHASWNEPGVYGPAEHWETLGSVLSSFEFQFSYIKYKEDICYFLE